MTDEDRLGRLESLVDRQAETIEALREQVAKMDGGGSAQDDGSRPSISRRTALKAGGLAGLLALGAGSASADPQGQVGTSTDPLNALYAQTVNTDGITDDGSGSVSLGTTLDVAGNAVTSSSGNITLDPSDHVVVSSDVAVEGTTDATNVGLSAYRGNLGQSIESASWETIVFDATNRDDFGGYDTSTGVYQVTHPNGGDYHVTANAEWEDRLDGQTPHNIRIRVNGVLMARRIREVAGPSSASSYVHEHISKTLFGLSNGDEIDIQVYQDSGSSQFVGQGEFDTYLTIHKVG